MILVTGAGGQLGLELREVLAGREAVFLTSLELDITDADACKRVVLEGGVDTIINAAAFTSVDKAESERERAFAVNEGGAMNLALAAREAGAWLLHISTDYVFDGKKTTPYTEGDVPNPQTVYGRSKLGGEDAVLAYAPDAMVVRTGWLYSAHGHNFMKTMMRLGYAKDELGVVNDQVGTPTHAGHLARDLVKMIDAGHGEGIYHYADEGEATWFDFAAAIMRAAGLACEVKPLSTQAYAKLHGMPAARPAYSVLDKGKVKADFGLKINDWQDGITGCVTAIKKG